MVINPKVVVVCDLYANWNRFKSVDLLVLSLLKISVPLTLTRNLVIQVLLSNVHEVLGMQGTGLSAT